MLLKRKILRVVRAAAFVVAGLVLLLFATVQANQWLLRWRAERLMADMHHIRLYQSTWADAQRLMYRWGAWGHYDGTCTEKDCRYRIVLTDTYSSIDSSGTRSLLVWVISHDRLNLLFHAGFRPGRVVVSITVQDGTIWREEAGLSVEGPAHGWWREDDDFPLELGI